MDILLEHPLDCLHHWNRSIWFWNDPRLPLPDELLLDSYTIYAASVLAANSILRSLFGAAFPLFTTQMYDALGIHWPSSVPAFLALACTLFPFLFYKYGESID